MDAIDNNREYRNSSRVNHKATVMFEARDDGNFYYATMHNFSGDGMYCESDRPLKPGTAIIIRLDNLPYKSAPKIYSGEIRRCEKLESDDHFYPFGLGIKIFESLSDKI